MNDWGRSAYGDPCRECGFDWGISLDDAVAVVSEVAGDCATVLAGANGDEQHPGLSWSVSAYVCHVGDNLTIWAERLVGSAHGGRSHVEAYDENELAAARGYGSIALPAALWTLSRSAEGWKEAVDEGARLGVTIVHPERGRLTVADVAVSNAHDAFHHRWDIKRSLAAAPGGVAR